VLRQQGLWSLISSATLLKFAKASSIRAHYLPLCQLSQLRSVALTLAQDGGWSKKDDNLLNIIGEALSAGNCGVSMERRCCLLGVRFSQVRGWRSWLP
jgi:hypothetical protein